MLTLGQTDAEHEQTRAAGTDGQSISDKVAFTRQDAGIKPAVVDIMKAGIPFEFRKYEQTKAQSEKTGGDEKGKSNETSGLPRPEIDGFGIGNSDCHDETGRLGQHERYRWNSGNIGQMKRNQKDRQDNNVVQEHQQAIGWPVNPWREEKGGTQGQQKRDDIGRRRQILAGQPHISESGCYQSSVDEVQTEEVRHRQQQEQYAGCGFGGLARGGGPLRHAPAEEPG